MARIAILLNDRCHPKECQWECQAYCPPVRMGQECIIEGPTGKPIISETLCIGCGICVHKCPFDAIKILNTPEADPSEIVHRYGYNGFRMYRMPIPPARGSRGSSARTGPESRPPSGDSPGRKCRTSGTTNPPEPGRRCSNTTAAPRSAPTSNGYRRGSSRSVLKPQYVDRISDEPFTALDYVLAAGPGGRKALDEVGLANRADRRLSELSGGELQLVSIARTIATDVDLYLIDEPSSYLDIVHRLEVARILRRLGETKSVLVVEHDLALLDYLADQAHLIYGEPAAFGVISHPLPMRAAINTYLTGYLKDENVRFRTEPVRFVSHPPKPAARANTLVRFPALEKEYPEFHLSVGAGSLAKGQVVGIVGPNATGKTTFVRMLAGVEPPTRGAPPEGVTVSYKPQYLKATQSASLRERAAALANDPTFDAKLFERELVPGLHLEEIQDVALTDLSGGELQRSAVALALARPATLYLLDEPSAYLDADERMSMARLVRRQVERQAVSALVVDHDVYFLDLACDELMVFGPDAPDGSKGRGDGPFAMREGMNRLLAGVNITFRRDPETLRPRINREGSVLDREQRARKEYDYEAAQ